MLLAIKYHLSMPEFYVQYTGEYEWDMAYITDPTHWAYQRMTSRKRFGTNTEFMVKYCIWRRRPGASLKSFFKMPTILFVNDLSRENTLPTNADSLHVLSWQMTILVAQRVVGLYTSIKET